MSKKGNKREKSQQQGGSSLANLTYYSVVTISCLVGYVSYSAGASLESAIARAVVALLACTVIAYVVNLFLMTTDPGQGKAGGHAAALAARNAYSAQGINLSAGDERPGQPSPARRRASGT